MAIDLKLTSEQKKSINGFAKVPAPIKYVHPKEKVGEIHILNKPAKNSSGSHSGRANHISNRKTKEFMWYLEGAERG